MVVGQMRIYLMAVSFGYIDIGPATMSTFQAGSHNWGEDMNHNLIKSAFLINGYVISRTQQIPENAPECSGYIDPDDGHIFYRASGLWFRITPVYGQQIYVGDEDAMYINRNGWKQLYLLSNDNPKVPREVNVFVKSAYVGGIVYTLAPSLEFSYKMGTKCPIYADKAGNATFEIVHVGINGQKITPDGLPQINKVVGSGTLSGNEGFLTFTESGTVLSASQQGEYAQPDRLNIVCRSWNGCADVTISLIGAVRGLLDG